MVSKKKFPIFEKNKKLVYLDNAATSQRPQSVLGAMDTFYKTTNANIHRGVYTLSEEATKAYEKAREKVAEFINADHSEIVFTKNTTESINLIANTIKPLFKKGKDTIILTQLEHHSNLIPWQQLAKKNNLKLVYIPITNDYDLDYEQAKKLINEKTALFACTYLSNVFGTIIDVKKLIALAKEKEAFTFIDAAQAAAHLPIDVKQLQCDFLAFSGHKIYGPFGIGALYGKKQLLEKLEPFQYGGGMIQSVSYQDATFANAPQKFEAGTPPITGAVGLAAAIDFVNENGLKNIQKQEYELIAYAYKKLKMLNNLELYLPPLEKNGGVISFNLKEIHPHDVAEILNKDNIAIRAGHHCCMPLMKKLNKTGTCRISFAAYNTKEDIDKLIESLKKVQEVFA